MKPNLLLLHGALGSSSELESLKNCLVNDFTIHTLNFEGHGNSISNKDFSIDLFTQNIIDYILKHKLNKVGIFGFSMGGYVAINLALRRPDMVGKIMTLGTKFNWSIASGEKEIKMLNPIKIEEKVPAFANYLQKIHLPNDWKVNMNKTAKLMSNLMNGEKLIDEDYSELNHKILLCLGSKDLMVSMEETKAVAMQMPNSQLQLIDGFEHPVSKVDKAILSNLIISYF